MYDFASETRLRKGLVQGAYRKTMKASMRLAMKRITIANYSSLTTVE